MVDNARVELGALEAGDDRVFTIKVAGPSALLIAKMHKLGDRHEKDPGRMNDKDAHDVYRLLVAIPTDVLASSLRILLTDPLSRDASQRGIRVFEELFATGAAAVGSTMAGRAEELLGDPALVAQATAALAQDLVAVLPMDDVDGMR